MSAHHPLLTSTPTTSVFPAMLLDTGTPTLSPASPAMEDSSSTKAASHVSAPPPLLSLRPMEDVLLAILPTTGTPLPKLASHAPETPTGTLLPSSVSAALKVSLSIPPTSSVPALELLPTMRSRPRSA